MPRYSPVAIALSYPMDNEDGIDRAILKNYAALISALEEIYKGNDEHAGRAGGIKTSMESFPHSLALSFLIFFLLHRSNYLFSCSVMAYLHKRLLRQHL